ncbi:signal peptidase I [Clostridium sp. CAG:798]|jgi:signal peptidase I|nr:signal peptidase I [Clostridium sp. CAG:798]
MKLDSKTKDILEWIICIVIAFILALFIRYYIGTPTIVKQKSMYPTLKQDQRLILNRWVRTKKVMPQRGDIITFEAPNIPRYTSVEEVDLSNPIANYDGRPTSVFSKFVYYVLELGKDSYIKRVIALPGEHVEIKNGKVYINGEELKEDYLTDDVVTEAENGAYTDIVVPENCIFVLGDNRKNSTDSRRFGCIPLNRVESKVWIRFWPFNLFGKVE